MFVWVIEKNFLIIFYEVYLFERIVEDSFEIVGDSLKEVGFGWLDFFVLKIVFNR